MKLRKVHSTYTDRKFACDCLVIGTGAGGAVAAAELAKNGLNVIVLEEGGFYSTEDFKKETPSAQIPKLYRNNGAIPFWGRPVVGFSEGRCVGGGTVINGGIFSRPPNEILLQWKNELGLAHFEPSLFAKYLDEVEHRIQAKAGAIGPGNRDSELLLEIGRKAGLEVNVSSRSVINCENRNQCPTGCPSGAKQSVVFNYLMDAEAVGARIFSRLRCKKIFSTRMTATHVAAIDDEGNEIQISFKYLFMAAGVTQTPFLLRKSRISRTAGRSIQFHSPLKLICEFNENLNSAFGTSSKTVLEAEEFKLAPSNFRPEYVALSLMSQGKAVMNDAFSNLNKMAVIMALVRTKSVARILTSIFDQPVITYRFLESDFRLIKRVLRNSLELLFLGGATRVFIPSAKTTAITSVEDFDKKVKTLKAADLEVLTVHAMSSCAMGVDPKHSVINDDGKVWGTQNIYVVDGSALPGTTGVGPQATIMALALMTTRNFIKSRSPDANAPEVSFAAGTVAPFSSLL